MDGKVQRDEIAMNEKGLLKNIDWHMVTVPGIIILILLTLGLVSPEAFGKYVDTCFGFTTKYFSWFFALGTTALMFFCFWAAFSKVGKIRLGGRDAKPEMSTWSWIAITFTSGMAMGVVFYGVGEGLMNFAQPPGFITEYAALSPEAAENAMKYVFVHWCMQPYAIYTAAGLGFAFVYWNTKRPYELSSGLYPLLHEKSRGFWGNVVNGLCLIAIVCTLGTNVGLGTLQLTAGIDYVFDLKYPAIAAQLLIITVLATVWVIAAATGIHKGIKHVSKINMYLFAFILIWAFVFSDFVFILNNTTTSIGKYLAIALPQAFYLEPAIQSGWISGWTIYYWAWWLTVAPFTGLFLMKLAKGRTIRSFVAVNFVVPIIFIFLWFGTFGSAGISKQMQGVDIWGEVQKYGFEVSFFGFLDTLPVPQLALLVGFVVIILSFITQAESMNYTISGMTARDKREDENGEQRSPIVLKIFWGVTIAAMGFVLIQSGGLNVVMRSVIMIGLPILAIIMLNAVAFVKAVTNRDKYDLTMTEEERKDYLAMKNAD